MARRDSEPKVIRMRSSPFPSRGVSPTLALTILDRRRTRCPSAEVVRSAQTTSRSPSKRVCQRCQKLFVCHRIVVSRSHIALVHAWHDVDDSIVKIPIFFVN